MNSETVYVNCKVVHTQPMQTQHILRYDRPKPRYKHLHTLLADVWVILPDPISLGQPSTFVACQYYGSMIHTGLIGLAGGGID